VDKGGTAVAVHGPHDLMEINYKAVRDAMKAVDGTAEKLIEIDGWTDSADRTEVKTGVVIENIQSITLLEL